MKKKIKPTKKPTGNESLDLAIDVMDIAKARVEEKRQKAQQAEDAWRQDLLDALSAVEAGSPLLGLASFVRDTIVWCGGVSSLDASLEHGAPLSANLCLAAIRHLRAHDHLLLLPRHNESRIVLGGSSICSAQLHTSDNLVTLCLGLALPRGVLPHARAFHALREQMLARRKCEDELRPLLPAVDEKS